MPNQGMAIFEPESAPLPADLDSDALCVSLTSIYVRSFQGHPELTEPVMRMLIHQHADKLGPELVQDALSRVGLPTDGIDKVGKVMWGSPEPISIGGEYPVLSLWYPPQQPYKAQIVSITEAVDTLVTKQLTNLKYDYHDHPTRHVLNTTMRMSNTRISSPMVTVEPSTQLDLRVY